MLCPSCATDNIESATTCQQCRVALAPAQGESLMQSIGQKRQVDTKKRRDKAFAGGAVAGFMAYYLLSRSGYDFGGLAGYPYFYYIGSACFGLAGGAIGRWIDGA